MSLEPLEFVLTEDHIKLLRASCVNDEITDIEFGAAEIDPKRPYGNSDVLSDLAELLDIPTVDDSDWGPQLSAEDEARLTVLHRETPRALQCVLASGSFIPGTYRTSAAYKRDWQMAAPAEGEK